MFSISAQEVIIPDKEPPTLICPQDIKASVVSNVISLPEPVFLEDNSGGSIDLTCTWPMNNTFSLGETKVTCTALDETGNVAKCEFSVTITGMHINLSA